jgi:hypothetical protein
MIWFWIDTTYACAGVATDETGTVVDAAPIYRRRFMGRNINYAIRELRTAGLFRAWARCR